MPKQFENLQVFIPASKISFNHTIQDKLNEYGKQGWEPVTVWPHREKNAEGKKILIQYEVYFKREKEPK